MDAENNKKIFKDLLMSTNKKGMSDLFSHLEKNGFFISPASSNKKYHGCFEGGLAQHSLNVYIIFKHNCKKYSFTDEKIISDQSLIISSLLHDVCKLNLYKKIDDEKYGLNYDVLKLGHTKRSLHIIKKFVSLNQREENLIKYHMGFFGSHELRFAGAEYSFKDMLGAIDKDPLVMLIHHADNEASKFVDVKIGNKL